MVTAPIHVSRKNYRGSDEKKRKKVQEFNTTALFLENYINDLLSKQIAETDVYTYAQIASATNIPIEVVRDLCFIIDGGHNGLTVHRSKR